MDPITLFLMFGAGLIGHEIGKSSAQERVQELQKEILRLHEVNRQREAEMAQLRAYIARTQQHIEVIRAQRGAFARFARWIVGEHPEIVQRYQYIQQAQGSLGALQQQGHAENQSVWQKYQALKQEFPKEMEEFEANARAQQRA